jgi:hypothetical protein
VENVSVTVAVPEEAFDHLADKLAPRLERLLVGSAGHTQWLNSREAVVYLRLPSVDALHRLTTRDAIPHRKVNGRCLFKTAELDDWLDGHYRGPARSPGRR